MKDYINASGFEFGSQNGDTKLYFIENPDGTPRWIWNAQNPRPDFLRFYAITSLRSRMFSLIIKFVFRLKLQHLIFKKSSLYVRRDESHVLAPFTLNHFALFTGTKGPNRKMILYAKEQFVKIALNETSEALINKEINTLNKIKSGTYVVVPQSRKVDKGIISLSDLSANGERQSTFSNTHAQALNELYTQSPILSMVFRQSEAFQESIRNIHSNEGKSRELVPGFLKEKLTKLADSMANHQLTFTWAHRDFTAWNCYVGSEKIHLYDFELAQNQLSYGFDVFHFVMQQGILVERLPWRHIKPKLKTAFEVLCGATDRTEESFESYLQAYLVINVAYHLDLYSRQESWHEQIQWLFNTWNDALSDMLCRSESQRALVIGDVFDFLQNQKYATVKFPNIQPSALSDYADIDLLTDNKTAQNLLTHLSDHSLVARIKVQSQSCMMSIMVALHDGQLLALDLIWQLKRKNLEFMDVASGIEGAIVNDFGIKCLNRIDTQDYLRHFYGLNGSPIPDKYLSFFEDISDAQLDTFELKKQVKNSEANTGLSGWVKRWKYLLDVMRKLFNEKGIIITFSGVDGAGKSTIIAHTKTIIEKKLRKKVVVIRHRPSLLPILSAITLGKAKAEQKAANTLPRQGNNKSAISSLLRFGYYYMDYLVGQFYVYARHVLRGEVVLYDRYYFDFINDGLRSNIRLPRWLTKAGYKLLLQPQLNFFLYADVKTILSRKKELNETAINELTRDYLYLFSELEAQCEGRYFPLENLQLENSLQFITAQAKAKII